MIWILDRSRAFATSRRARFECRHDILFRSFWRGFFTACPRFFFVFSVSSASVMLSLSSPSIMGPFVSSTAKLAELCSVNIATVIGGTVVTLKKKVNRVKNAFLANSRFLFAVRNIRAQLVDFLPSELVQVLWPMSYPSRRQQIVRGSVLTPGDPCAIHECCPTRGSLLPDLSISTAN